MTGLKKGFDFRWDVVSAIPSESGRSLIVRFADWTVRELDLQDLVYGDDAGVFANLAVTGTPGRGWATTTG